MSWRLIQCVREGLVPDMDVYDAATWSAPAPLSEASVKGGSSPVAFPDFTRGRWQQARPSFVVSAAEGSREHGPAGAPIARPTRAPEMRMT
jgi:hypothetical protein